jgi:hypothetical protein
MSACDSLKTDIKKLYYNITQKDSEVYDIWTWDEKAVEF